MIGQQCCAFLRGGRHLLSCSWYCPPPPPPWPLRPMPKLSIFMAENDSRQRSAVEPAAADARCAAVLALVLNLDANSWQRALGFRI